MEWCVEVKPDRETEVEREWERYRVFESLCIGFSAFQKFGQFCKPWQLELEGEDSLYIHIQNFSSCGLTLNIIHSHWLPSLISGDIC